MFRQVLYANVCSVKKRISEDHSWERRFLLPIKYNAIISLCRCLSDLRRAPSLERLSGRAREALCVFDAFDSGALRQAQRLLQHGVSFSARAARLLAAKSHVIFLHACPLRFWFVVARHPT
jgi:hypothetical protein